ncbi:MAG: glutamate 5-kinase [Alphaproteobacteria bacterium]
METPDRLRTARRVVVKIGSALVIEGETGTARREWLEALADDVVACRARGSQVVVVSSGAIALGRRRLGLAPGALKLEEKQAAAAAGQAHLMEAYQSAFGRHCVAIAQVLLTLDDTEQRRRHLNARGTLRALLDLKAVPIVNENDTVATEEIRFGDNDRLAARVAVMIGADLLVLLSDIDGLYTADPRRDKNASLVPMVDAVTPAIEAMAGAAQPGDSSGGMVTKIAAARIATTGGCAMLIADGRRPHPLRAIEAGAPSTHFRAEGEARSAWKRWIGGSLKPVGRVAIDKGAARALKAGGSLLPAGVVAIDGAFERGDPVRVTDRDGHEVGRGLSAYSAEDAKRIMGHKSTEIEAILGYRGRDELIHRDDLVLV